MDTYSFLITSIIIILLLGTGVIYTMSTGISRGKKESMIAALGCTLGILPHLCIIIMLLLVFHLLNNQVIQIIQWIGAAYLLYLRIGIIISNMKFELNDEEISPNSSKIIKRAILINVLNPKLTLFFFSFSPQYVQVSEQSYFIKSIILGLLYMLVAFVIFCEYGYIAGTIRTYIARKPKTLKAIQVLLGVLFIAFSIKMIL